MLPFTLQIYLHKDMDGWVSIQNSEFCPGTLWHEINWPPVCSQASFFHPGFILCPEGLFMDVHGHLSYMSKLHQHPIKSHPRATPQSWEYIHQQYSTTSEEWILVRSPCNKLFLPQQTSHNGVVLPSLCLVYSPLITSNIGWNENRVELKSKRRV